MGPTSYMRSVVDGNVMRRIPVIERPVLNIRASDTASTLNSTLAWISHTSRNPNFRLCYQRSPSLDPILRQFKKIHVLNIFPLEPF